MEQLVERLVHQGIRPGVRKGDPSAYLLIRTTVSRMAAIVLIALSLPLMVLIAIAIRLDSDGPIIFRQVRVGRFGRKFRMYKFRTMHDGAEEMLDEVRHLNEEPSQLIIKIKDDPRVTRLGRFLRGTSLDELPQLFNILKGEMAVVGPRPPTPDEVEQYDDYQIQRLRTTPGLTGLWQVSGRKNLSFNEMVELDVEYADRQSLWLDLWIMLMTIPAVLRADGAR